MAHAVPEVPPYGDEIERLRRATDAVHAQAMQGWAAERALADRLYDRLMRALPAYLVHDDTCDVHHYTGTCDCPIAELHAAYDAARNP